MKKEHLFEERYDFKPGTAHFDYTDSFSLSGCNTPFLKLPMLSTYRDRKISAVNTPKPNIKMKPRSRSDCRLFDRLTKSLEQSKLVSNKIEKNVKFRNIPSKSINYDSSRSRSLSREKIIDNTTSDDDGFEEIFNSSGEFEKKIYDRKRLSILNADNIEINDYIHDEETKEVLYVKFPPWMTSTHGLSRPCSPSFETSERYYHLLNNCINKLQLADLPKDWILNMHKKIPNKNLFDLHKDYMKSFNEDMHENYYWSIKKAILDYILKDAEEQKRVGVKTIPKV